jgi:hypothetical protein
MFEMQEAMQLGSGVAVKPVVYWHRERPLADLGLSE